VTIKIYSTNFDQSNVTKNHYATVMRLCSSSTKTITLFNSCLGKEMKGTCNLKAD